MPTVLITGASRGIGLRFAQSYAEDGWRVIAGCRQPEKCRELKEMSDKVAIHRLDVTDGLQVASLARELAEERIDLLINNAGVYGPRVGFGETDYDEWLEVFKVNTLAPLRVAERFVDLVAAGEQRLIVNVSSQMGSIADNTSGSSYIYRSSKAALNMVTKGLSVDLAERGIRVIAVHPGWVQTDMGGQGASITAEESVAGLRKVFETLPPDVSGRFYSYNGKELPW